MSVNRLRRSGTRLNAGLIASIALAFLAASPVEAQSREVEANAVYRVVLDTLYLSGPDYPGVIVLADTLFPRTESVAWDGRLLIPHESSIDRQTIEDFDRATSSSGPFPGDLGYERMPVVRFTEAIRLSLVARGDTVDRTTPESERREMGFWVAFAERFPTAWGITYLSRVGFNARMDQAMLFLRHQCGGGCSGSESLFLRKVDGVWRLVERIDQRDYPAESIGVLRGVGRVTRQWMAERKRIADSTQRAFLDSIDRDRAPRRIRGRAVSRKTGLPVAFGQIFVRSSSEAQESLARVLTDAQGYYEIKDPPIGTTMLELQCPGPAHREGATLDAPGLYVFPQLDTVVNMSVLDIEPCWQPRRVRSVQSGESTDGVHSTSETPGRDESGVYAAVLEALFPKGPSKASRPIIEGWTHTRCGRMRECAGLDVAHLLRSGVIDSSALVEFGTRAKLSVPLNRGFAARVGLRLLSRAERSYLENEGAWIGKQFSGEPHPSDFWKALKAAYPGTVTVVSLTLPGFDRSRSQALVEVQLLGEESIGGREIILLRKQGERWTIARRHLEKDTMSAEMVGGQCLPMPAGTAPSQKELSAINGDFLFTLASNTRGPRVSEWRAKFFRKQVQLEDPDLRSLDARKRALIIRHMKLSLPSFAVLDVKTGKRTPKADPGTSIGSAGRSFASDSRVIQFDGSGVMIEINRVTGDALFGRWEHYSFGIPIDANGSPLPEPRGHFCAVRKPA